MPARFASTSGFALLLTIAAACTSADDARGDALAPDSDPTTGDGDAAGDSGDHDDAPTGDEAPFAAIVRPVLPAHERQATTRLAFASGAAELDLPEPASRGPGTEFVARVRYEATGVDGEGVHLDLGRDLAPLVPGEQWVLGAWPAAELAPWQPRLVRVGASPEPEVLATTTLDRHPSRHSVRAARAIVSVMQQQVIAAPEDDAWTALGSALADATLEPLGVTTLAAPGDTVALPCPGDLTTDPTSITATVDALQLEVAAATPKVVFARLPDDAPTGPVVVTLVRTQAPLPDGTSELLTCLHALDVLAVSATAPSDASPTPSLALTVSGASDTTHVFVRDDDTRCVAWSPDGDAVVAAATGEGALTGEATRGSMAEPCATSPSVAAGPATALSPESLSDAPAVPHLDVAPPPFAPPCPAVPASTQVGWRDLAYDGRPWGELLVDRTHAYTVFALPTACEARVDPAAVRSTDGDVAWLEQAPDPTGRGDEDPTVVVEFVYAIPAGQCVTVTSQTMFTDASNLQPAGLVERAGDEMKRIARLTGATSALAALLQLHKAKFPAGFEPSAFKVAALLHQLIMRGYDAVKDDPDFQKLVSAMRQYAPTEMAEIEKSWLRGEGNRGLVETGALGELDFGLFYHLFQECGAYVTCMGCTLTGESHHFVHRAERDQYVYSRWHRGEATGEVTNEGPDYDGPRMTDATPP